MGKISKATPPPDPYTYSFPEILDPPLFRNTIRVSNSVDPDDVMSGLIWVQTVCKGYQQTLLVGKEFYKNLSIDFFVFVGITLVSHLFSMLLTVISYGNPNNMYMVNVLYF